MPRVVLVLENMSGADEIVEMNERVDAKFGVGVETISASYPSTLTTSSFEAALYSSIEIAVDKIVNAGATKIMYRGMSAGIILAVLAMYVYDMHDDDFNYGPVMDSLHFSCTLILIVGAEVYHRVSLQDATFETVYPEVLNLYEDEGVAQ